MSWWPKEKTKPVVMDPVTKDIPKITLKPAYEAKNTADAANDVKYAEFTKDLLEHIKALSEDGKYNADIELPSDMPGYWFEKLMRTHGFKCFDLQWLAQKSYHVYWS